MWSGPNLRKKIQYIFGVKHGKPQSEKNSPHRNLVQDSPVIKAETLPNPPSFSILEEVKLQIILVAFYVVPFF